MRKFSVVPWLLTCKFPPVFGKHNEWACTTWDLGDYRKGDKGFDESAYLRNLGRVLTALAYHLGM